MARPTLGPRAMTNAERQRKYRKIGGALSDGLLGPTARKRMREDAAEFMERLSPEPPPPTRYEQMKARLAELEAGGAAPSRNVTEPSAVTPSLYAARGKRIQQLEAEVARLQAASRNVTEPAPAKKVRGRVAMLEQQLADCQERLRDGKVDEMLAHAKEVMSDAYRRAKEDMNRDICQPVEYLQTIWKFMHPEDKTTIATWVSQQDATAKPEVGGIPR